MIIPTLSKERLGILLLSSSVCPSVTFFLSYTALTLYELNKQTFYVCSIRRIGQRGEQWGTDKEYTDSSAVIYEIETLFKVTARIDEKLDKLIGHMHSWDLL